MGFELVVNSGDSGEVRVGVSGDLDMFTSPRLRERLVGLIAQGARQVTVDLQAVTFVDSTELGVLVGCLRRLRQVGGDLIVKAPTPGTLKVLEMTGLTRILTVTRG